MQNNYQEIQFTSKRYKIAKGRCKTKIYSNYEETQNKKSTTKQYNTTLQ